MLVLAQTCAALTRNHVLQADKGALNDALAALNLPNGLFTCQSRQFSNETSAAPVASAPDHKSCLPTAPHLSGPTQLAPQPIVFPPSPFLTALEHPTNPPAADSLFQGAPAVPPLLTCRLSDPAHSSINDSARSCLTGSGGAFHTAGLTGSGSGKTNSSGSGSGGAPAESSVHAPTETAVHHPTLSSLLSNPLFALPSAASGAAVSGNNCGMQKTFASTCVRHLSCDK